MCFLDLSDLSAWFLLDVDIYRYAEPLESSVCFPFSIDLG